MEKYLSNNAERFFNIMKEYKSLDSSSQRFIYFSIIDENPFQPISYINDDRLKKYGPLVYGDNVLKLYEDEEKLSIYTINYKLCFTNHSFFKHSATSGITYNKIKKKVNIWFGQNIDMTLVRKLLSYKNIDWFRSVPSCASSKINKTLLSKILSGSITNVEDYIKCLLKVTFNYQFPYKTVKKFFENEITLPWNNSLYDLGDLSDYLNQNTKKSEHSFNIDKIEFLYLIRDYTINPSYTLDCIVNKRISYEYFESFRDMLKECRCVNEKINIKWSEKRLNQEHARISRRISEERIKNEKKITIEMFGELPLIKGVQMILMRDNYEFFYESMEMNNCVFSSYFSRAKHKTMFFFSIKSPQRCTMSIEKTNKNGEEKFIIEQIKGKNNTSVDNNFVSIIETWLSNADVQDFFKKNYETLTEEEYKNKTIKAA